MHSQVLGIISLVTIFSTVDASLRLAAASLRLAASLLHLATAALLLATYCFTVCVCFFVIRDEENVKDINFE